MSSRLPTFRFLAPPTSRGLFPRLKSSSTLSGTLRQLTTSFILLEEMALKCTQPTATFQTKFVS